MEVITDKREVVLHENRQDANSESPPQTLLEPDAPQQTRLGPEAPGLEGDEFPTAEDWEELEQNPPADLQALIARLDDVFSEKRPTKVNVEYVHRLMSAYNSNRADWAQFAKFDRYRCAQ